MHLAHITVAAQSFTQHLKPLITTCVLVRDRRTVRPYWWHEHPPSGPRNSPGDACLFWCSPPWSLLSSTDANVKLYTSIYQARWHPRLYWCAAKVYLGYFYRPWRLSPLAEFRPSTSLTPCRSRILEAARHSRYHQPLQFSHSLLCCSASMLGSILSAVRAWKIMASFSPWSVYVRVTGPLFSNSKSDMLHRFDYRHWLSYVHHTVKRYRLHVTDSYQKRNGAWDNT